MSNVWYKDPNTGELYQDRIEKGRTIRVYEKLVKEASRAESSIDTRARSPQREKSSVREENARRDRRPSYPESDQAQQYPQGSASHAGEPSEEYYNCSRQQSTSYQPRDSFDSAQSRYLIPRPIDPDTRDPLTEGFAALHVSGDEHCTHSASVGTSTKDWQPAVVSSRHEETTYFSSDRDPPQPIYSSHDYDDEQPPAVPQMQQPEPNRVIKGTPGPSERIDPSYKVRTRDYKTFFRVGRVFSTLWTDALGNNAGKDDHTFVSEALYGERVYSKIRRFIVVREGERSVSCLPVTSYANEGIRKSGIRLDEHGFIYSRNKPTKIEEMCSRPLKLNLAQGAAHLKDPSLVNYGKVYHVETNVKVKNVGTVDGDSEAVLLHYFRKIYSGLVNPGGRDPPSVYYLTTSASNDYLMQPTSSCGQNPDQYPPQDAYTPQRSGAPVYQNHEDEIDLTPDPDREAAIAKRRRSHVTAPRRRGDPESLKRTHADIRESVASGITAPVSSGQTDVEGVHKPCSDDHPNPRYAPEPVISHDESQTWDSNLPDHSKSSSPQNLGSSTIYAKAQTSRTPLIQYSSDEMWRTTMPSLPSQQLGSGHASKKRLYLWLCCECGDGPCSVKIIPACPECSHRRCDNCITSPKPQSDVSGQGKEVFIKLDSKTEQNHPDGDQDLPYAISRDAIQAMCDEKPDDQVDPKSSALMQKPCTTVPATNPKESNIFDNAISSKIYLTEPIIDPGSSAQAVKFENDPKQANEIIISDTLYSVNADTKPYAKNSEFSRRQSPDSDDSTDRSTLLSAVFSGSSVSSVDNGYGKTQRIFEFLSNQKWLQALSAEALRKVSPVKFEKNLRRILVQFAVHLHDEATSRLMLQVAGAVRRRARNTASLLRQSFEAAANSTDDVQKQPVKSSNRVPEDEEEDEDDDDLLENTEGGEHDSKDLELLLTNSLALQMLKENLELLLYPDPVKGALFQIWPITQPRSSSLEIQYSVEWEVPQFLSTYFAEEQDLGTILTITGEAENVQAHTCGAYLSQTWPEIGPILLNRMHEVLSRGNAGIFKSSDGVLLDIKMNYNTAPGSFTSNVTLLVLADHSLHVQIAAALSWISAAVRHSSHNCLSYSSTTILAKPPKGASHTIAIYLEDLELLRDEGPCWYSLVPHGVIAKGFPIRERTVGKGLEISFADMAILSQSMSFTESGGGFVVEGLRTVLIPVKIIEGDDAIQWHLEYKRHPKLPKKMNVSEILADQRFFRWYRAQEPCQLTGRRCFLGWAEEIAVVIGTAEYSNNEIYCSGALPTPKTRNVKINSISLGASGFGLFGAKGSKSWHTTSVPCRIPLELDKDIYDTLADEYLTRVMVYDTDDKISWLLPQASVILYMIHRIIVRRRYRLFDGDREVDFIFAAPVADGAKEADSTLRKLLRLKVQKSEYLKECLSRTVRQVLLLLDQVGDGLKSVSTDFEPTGPAGRSRLYGVEFNDVLEMRCSLEIKQAHVDQPWTRMVRDGSVVLFGTGISQPIISMSPYMCATYTRVPPSRDLMVTTGEVLDSILHHHHRGPKGSRLGDEIEWLKEATLIQSHVGGENLSVFHEQRLRVVKQARLDPSIFERVKCQASSGFIFTDHRSRKACSEAVVSAKHATCSSVKEDSAVHDNTSFSNVPEEDSNSVISSENEYDFDFNETQLPNSSISSNESPRLEMDCKEFGAIVSRLSDAGTDGRVHGEVNETLPMKWIPTTGISTSSIPRIVKRKSRCMDLKASFMVSVASSTKKDFD